MVKFSKLRTAWSQLKQEISLTESSPSTYSDSLAYPQITDSPARAAIPKVNNLRKIKIKAGSKGSFSGFFDGINGYSATKIKVPKVTPVTISGWAILANEGRPADKVIITYGENNSLVAVAPVNLERSDVAEAFSNPAYKNCGWSITLNPFTFPAGKVELKAWAYNAARKEATQLNSTLTDEVLPEVITVVADNEEAYSKWLSKNFPREADLEKMAQTVAIFGYKPALSVIMPVFNPPEHFLREAIESVLNQVYPYWELCIADDASTQPDVRSVLEEYISKDARVKVVFRTENGHISRASNSALELATGEFVTLLDHDDLLTPDALYEVALLLNRHPDADMIYSDEDKVDEHDQFREPFFKPDWCPDSFLSRNYTCHLGTYRRSLVAAIGGFRAGYEGSQDYDLVLRLTEKTEKIFHIPKILYHWRIHSQSAANDVQAKPYAYIAAEKALSDALCRRGENGRVSGVPEILGHYNIRYKIEYYQLVSIIIPTKDLGETLDQCLESIFTKSIYPNYEVVVIDNGSTEEYTAQVINKWNTKEPNRFKCYQFDVPFNFSKINNYAVSQTKGEYLLFLNNDIEVISSDWIDAMVEQAQRSSIGAVGALLLYPDDTIQHAGIVLGIGGVASHSHKHLPSKLAGYAGQVISINNYSAITAACLMCRREVYDRVQGFEEELAVAYNDVDFCLKLVQQGYRNIYLPHVVLYHHESKSRGSEDTPEKQARLAKEAEYMQKKWNKILKNDSCYNPHLTKKGDDYSIDI
ncbi:glycosyltransferase family 2 protein [Chroococcidiopsis sp. CCMEE 29]|uniref:glycosyltransferase family 2 protein n=1 Tax=Chroococcidiopsis sp. CCMEE 29 TaxID=155894 RepID=UPI0020229497|nr:glycosyltransferase family 2 protein [Chroococcidiopsis sp. CCMEE 29]